MKAEFAPLKPGVAGVEETIAEITRAIRKGASNPAVIEEARRAVRRARPHDTEAEWRELWRYVTGLYGFPYRFDPVDVELVYGAHLGSSIAGGDCDDFTVRSGALLEALGYPVQVEIIGSRAPAPGREPAFHHVFLRAFDPRSGRWKAFDPVLDKPGRFKAAPGMELKAAVRREFPVSRPTLTTHQKSSAGGRTYGYSADATLGYSQNQLGSWFYENILKPFDPTRDDNAAGKAVRTILQNAPGGGTVLTALDAHAAANKALTQQPKPDPTKVPAQTATKGAPAGPTIATPARMLATGIARQNKREQQAASTTTKTEALVMGQTPPPSSSGLTTGEKFAIGAGALGLGLGIAKLFSKKKARR